MAGKLASLTKSYRAAHERLGMFCSNLWSVNYAAMSYRFSGYAESNLVKPSHMRNKTTLLCMYSMRHITGV